MENGTEKKIPDDEQMKVARNICHQIRIGLVQFHAYHVMVIRTMGMPVFKMEPTYPNPPEANHRARSLIGQRNLTSCLQLVTTMMMVVGIVW